MQYVAPEKGAADVVKMPAAAGVNGNPPDSSRAVNAARGRPSGLFCVSDKSRLGRRVGRATCSR